MFSLKYFLFLTSIWPLLSLTYSSLFEWNSCSQKDYVITAKKTRKLRREWGRKLQYHEKRNLVQLCHLWGSVSHFCPALQDLLAGKLCFS